MVTRKFIITTRPENKVVNYNTKNIDVINIPLTEMHPILPDYSTAERIKNMPPDVVVLTSSFGADVFFKYYMIYFKIDPVFIAIGNSTAAEIRNKGFNPIIPEERDSYGIINLLKNYRDKYIGLFRSTASNKIIYNFLRENHYNFSEFFIYSLRIIENNIASYCGMENCDGIVLTSSLEAEIFLKVCPNPKIKIYPIGKVTDDTLKKHGIKTCTTGIESDIKEIINYIDSKKLE
ncbi:uroporphyrinogen-III synthase [Acidiplasma aeolicum]|jgi:uroporphyrinogen-III synthase|uniref:uroporphyrinogen-III synthase n=1 Tax=Acidiplasma aeolicum TaxID=507754 RepID=UPI00371DB4A7